MYNTENEKLKREICKFKQVPYGNRNKYKILCKLHKQITNNAKFNTL